MQNIPYVRIDVSDVGDEEVAMANAEYTLKGDEEMRKVDGAIVFPSRYLKVIALGTKVLEVSNDTIDAHSLEYMFKCEAKARLATSLIAGRRLITAVEGEERAGLLEGLELDRF